MQIRHQVQPAGLAWSEVYFAAMPDIGDPEVRRKAFGAFCIDAEFVLKERLSIASKTGRTASKGDGAQSMGSGFNIAQLLGQRDPVQIADAARAVSTATIGATVASYLAKTGDSQDYVTSFIFQAVIVLALREGLTSVAVQAAACLAKSSSEADYLLYMATLPAVKALFASGACAAGDGGVDEASVAAYLNAIQCRPQFAHPASRTSPFMVDSIVEFTQRLGGTPLAGRKLLSLPILDTPERAYAMITSPGEMEQLWRAARELVPTTQRWPLITTCWNGGLSVQDAIMNEDFFSRFSFNEAPNVDDVSPRALLAAADAINPVHFVGRMLKQRNTLRARFEDFDELVTGELDDTLGRCGSAPSREEVSQAVLDGRPITTAYQLDRWLFNWEQAHGGSGDPDMARQAWYEPDPVILLFLPTPHCWDALAYLNWFGTSDFGSENYIALGRAWEKKFGAELFAHFGTMLECFVTRPPETHQDAWDLAQQHDLAASCTLPPAGIALRHYATGLMDCDRWFLHERP